MNKLKYILPIFLVSIMHYSITYGSSEICTISFIAERKLAIRHPDEEFSRIIKFDVDTQSIATQRFIHAFNRYEVAGGTKMYLCDGNQNLFYHNRSVSISDTGKLYYEENFLCAPEIPLAKFFAESSSHVFECTIDINLLLEPEVLVPL